MAHEMTPEQRKYFEAAKKLHEMEGELEFDEQPGKSVVSKAPDKAGAYVACWLWVSDDDVKRAKVSE